MCTHMSTRLDGAVDQVRKHDTYLQCVGALSSAASLASPSAREVGLLQTVLPQLRAGQTL